MPNCCIGVDVIIGFPGETEEEFNKTYEFLNQLDVSYLHVFTYSERANTTALRIDEVVPMEDRQKRSKMLRILSAKKKRKFYEDNIGTTHKVLWEAENTEGFMYGFTENYVKVRTNFDPNKVNTTETVTLTDISRSGEVNVEILGTISV